MCTLLLLLFLLFFFFKQKTAYEMRISDWSSDVCSSDLPRIIVQDVDVAMRLEPRLSRGDVRQVEPVDARPRARGFDQSRGFHEPRFIDVDQRDLRRPTRGPHHRCRAADTACGPGHDPRLGVDIHDFSPAYPAATVT